MIIRLVVLMAFTTLQLSRTERRILEGKDLTVDKPYVAYFSKASKSDKQYDAWVCGGAIVTHKHIITSAACLADVEKMYAIAGYNKYIPSDLVDTDACTSASKKQVIQTCMPINYAFEYEKASIWSNADIGVAKIKGSFDFKTKIEGCSYAPSVIAINYKSNWQGAGMHAIVMGWGHDDVWRDNKDTTDLNSKTLKFAKVKIVDKQKCVDAYKNVENLEPVINKFMICTHGPGRMNVNGDLEGPESFERDEKHEDGCELRGPDGRCLRTIQKANKHKRGDDRETTVETTTIGREGICQNDHGGPLITFAGRAERLIGIASVFLINPTNRKCEGPFMYTSTFCNQQFLRCFFGNLTDLGFDVSQLTRRKREELLDMPEEESRRFYLDFCLQPPALRGFEMVERIISWSTNNQDDDSEEDKKKQKTKTTMKTATKTTRVRPPNRSPFHPQQHSTVQPLRRPPVRTQRRSRSRPPFRTNNRLRNRPPSKHVPAKLHTRQQTGIYEGFLHRHQIPLSNFG